jgi:Spy/CpxP family protein refolding chaperone
MFSRFFLHAFSGSTVAKTRSAFDRAAMQTLRQKMFAVLTPQQQMLFEQNVQQMRAQRSKWRNLNLTDEQRTQMHQLIAQYRQAHPAGSSADPQARAQLYQRIRNLLTPQQRSELQQSRAQL